MLKHRGFPGRLPGTDFQFIIRRANKKGATPLVRRERYRDRKPADRRADTAFLAALIQHFGEEPFPRGNLDAGRLSWLIGREVVAVGKLDPTDYDQLLRVDMKRAEASFPELFAADAPEFDWEESGWDEGDWDDEDED
ncbi:hypothetical protein ACDP63_00130 [Paracoccus sp. P2]|uniref:Uncharacterized protein n=1 Tax=Paracoccus pantotrophus TaxID=82367 RepID=A0A1I5J6G4_PARPN|nr:hypothetical protein [Paracoccus pantotrophus]MDF3854039.1 hypothetical protein [Paracoccus pantotrophus]QFG34988.1 hypothetical protein ESD82_01965 [Paracoccus pantotrophus]QLH13232.1 hypothetical protein HYQ43_02760 [Paracoccus pantotrophus]RDD97566.1 hypothetical protein DTW92_07815 [Paracoccus pantotrophus]RKS44838.1 hypothetical protein BDE18_3694 [Paracoccus pantotrophus]